MKNILNSIASFFKGLFKALFGSKNEKIRNKHLFKRGGYAVAIIALVIAVAIVVNILTGLLAKRVTLEFDMTADKKNSVSKENAEYIKNEVDKEINIYVLSPSAEAYSQGGMAQAAQNSMFYANTSEYYLQTTVLLEQYERLNSKINVEYIDPNGTEVGEIVSKYGVNYSYGDIIVTCDFEQDGKKFNNDRALTLVDVYSYTENNEYAAMGVTMYEINGNCLETSLTSAIASVTSTESVKVGLITSHSRNGIFSYYKKLLETNNFEVSEITDTFISKISDEYDAIVIAAPTNDFASEELSAISDYLENGGKMGKNLVFYGDSTYQNLPNLYNFLEEWGIIIENGIVFEINDSLHISGDYATYLSLSATSNVSFITTGAYYLSGYNIPMYESKTSYAGRETTTLLTTNGSSVIVPVGTDSSVAPGDALERRKLSACIISKESDYVDNVPVSSNVIAFSSVDFISESYAQSYRSMADYDGLNVNSLRYMTGVNEIKKVFETKTIEETSQLYVVSSQAAKNMRIVFAAIIPVLVLLVAFVIFFRRRNK